MAVGGNNGIESLQANLGAETHQSVVDILHVGIVGNGEVLLQNDAACVDIVVEEERCHARLRLTIDDGPVDGGGTAVLRQQGGMDIERAVLGHRPDYLGQHAESDDHLQVGFV